MSKTNDPLGPPAVAAAKPLRWLPIVLVTSAVAAGALLFALWRWKANSTPSLASTEEPIGPPFFRDVTAESGIDHTYRNGEEVDHYAILESLGGGLAAIDFDNDGLMDLFFAGGGHYEGPDHKQIKGNPCKLYRNLGNFRFADVTAQMGLDTIAFFTHGAAAADYDNDGWPDLLVTGWHHLALFHNEPLDARNPSKGRKFVDVSRQAGLHEGLWTTSAAWGDLDGDGYADLYVCQYVNWSMEYNPSCSYDGHTRDVCPPKQFVGLEHKLFRNVGNGTFQDISKSAGLRVPRSDAEFEQLTWLSPYARDRLKYDVRKSNTLLGKGLGVLMVDVNGDGKPDIYVCNDTVDNFLYCNRSDKKGQVRLEELGLPSGAAEDDGGNPQGSMGVDAGDPYGTGRPAIFVANYENELHALYRNDCKDTHISFTFDTSPAGLAVFGRLTVGWGTAFVDLDHDGWEDLFLITGHAIRKPTIATRPQRPILARNIGGGKFKDITRQGGSYFNSMHIGRGAVLADFDNDGRPDIAVVHTNEKVALLRNEAETQGRHWLGMELAGKNHRDVVGAKLILETDGRKQTRFAKGGGSYASSPDRRHVFGLGSADRIDKVTVVWPSGARQEYTDLMSDHYYRITEGSVKAQALYEKKEQK